MEAVLEKKSERSRAKQAVSVAARRLTGAIVKEEDEECLNDLVLYLERAYDDFCEVNDEFQSLVSPESFAEHRVVNHLDIEAYSNVVKDVYDTAMAEFVKIRSARAQAVRDAEILNTKSALSRKVIQLQELISSVQRNLSSNCMDTMNQDKDDLDKLMDELWSIKNKLSLLQSEDGEIYSQVEDTERVVCSLKRDIKQCLKQSQAATEPLDTYNYSTPFNQDLLSSIMTPGQTLGCHVPIQSSTTMTTTSHVITTPQRNFVSQTNTQSNVPPSNYNPTMSHVFSTPQSNIVRQASVQSNVTLLSYNPIISHVITTPQGNFNQSSVQHELKPTSAYPLTPLVPPAQWKSPTTAWSTGHNNPSVTFPSSNNNTSANVSAVAALDAQSTRTNWSPGMNFSSNTTSDVRLKKIALPTFSGMRKDWPEFKAVWKQLAENTYTNKTALAHELKRSVKGEASARIKSVYVTKHAAYDTMWRKLEEHYEDPSASVQAALDDLSKLKPVKEEDYKGLVSLIDEVECAYSQLEELNHLETLTMRDVDFVSDLLPTHLKLDWIRKYHDLPPAEKLHPFASFMKFLEHERKAVARLTEKPPPKLRSPEAFKNVRTHHTDVTTTQQSPKQFYKCAYPAHRKDAVKHSTEDCREFQKLAITGKESKMELLKEVNACFLCFGDHKKSMCPNKKPCYKCGSEQHHFMLCKSEKQKDAPKPSTSSHAEGASHVSHGPSLALYPIQQAKVSGTNKELTVFCDSGSNTTYITHSAADKIKAKRLNKYTLDVTTMGNIETTYDTVEYQFTLQTVTGKKVDVKAFGMDKITGPVSKLDTDSVSELFPMFDPNCLQRKNTYVDVLLGCDYFGLHPKKEEAKSGQNLSVMSGEFGVCLQGTHPSLKEKTVLDSNLAKTVHNSVIKTGVNHSLTCEHFEFQPVLDDVSGSEVDGKELFVNVASSKGKVDVDTNTENFIKGEDLGTETTPKCGRCRCGKCPITGHTYSFQEEQELKQIQENLKYDEERQCWITSYPWISDPLTLPDNYSSAYSTLRSTERTLSKDKQWSETYQRQMEDMVDRNVARKLTREEIDNWKGPVFYISHLAVVNTKSQSTPVRIVFNSSQVFQGVSLNSYLAKGPDSYLNNLLGILLRWREEQEAVVGDIKKMFNSVLLKPLEQHCHRFLWRDLDKTRDPEVYVIQRVNMGDKPASAISTEALYKTAERFKDESPRAASFVKNSSYVDDLIDSFPSKSEALSVARETEIILAKGGFKIKCWQFSGESSPRSSQVSQPSQSESHDTNANKKPLTLLKGSQDNLRVLGTGWDPVEDTIVYEVNLNFSKKRKSEHVSPNLRAEDVPEQIPGVLTKRMVLGQVMKIYDPLGLVCPFTLRGKIYLRKTWSLNLDWDDPLPDHLRDKWIQFFKDTFQLEQLYLNRCVKPTEAVGSPWLIILSDGSDLAYGFAAYVRWKLKDESFRCQLIMAKSRIAPMTKLSTPQMELNAAVLSKRGRKVIEREMRFKFEKVLQLVDSETVLSMINKTSTRFKVYEGVRIGEIQAATDGDMSCWAWLPGKENTADWLTRGRSPAELDNDSQWWNGPEVLSKPFEEWKLKYGLQREDILPGEKKLCNTAATEVKQRTSLIDYKTFSNIKRVIWVIARIQSIAKKKSFAGGKSSAISAQDLMEAEKYVVKDIQKSIYCELEKKNGQYHTLKPILDEDGLWVVGRRLRNYNIMTADSTLQKLLPTCHPGTRLLMERAHREGHRGRDATLSRFRQYYWVPHGSKLANSVKKNCQTCKLREATFSKQEMGPLPDVRLKPAPAFNSVMLDLFGPYTVRGKVQKRVSGKAYGVIFTDLTMRAVHIEAVYGYDTSSFLMALSRFASLRGWPQTIYSDQGSQLVGAERELKEAWKRIDTDTLQRDSANKGTTWVFGPADSPWYQGAVESLVKSAKRAIHFAVHNQRLSVPEFQTLCCEVSNLLNERPIGSIPGIDSELNILTPNSLLLGRATAVNPRGWQPQGSCINTRYRIVQSITDEFWKKWTELYAPTLIVQRKWNTAQRNLQPGDVVIIADKNTLRGEYRLGEVKEVYPSADGKVRQVSVRYKSYKTGEKVHHYSGARDIVVSRSIHRLAVLVPADFKREDADLDLKKSLKGD